MKSTCGEESLFNALMEKTDKMKLYKGNKVRENENKEWRSSGEHGIWEWALNGTSYHGTSYYCLSGLSLCSP